MRKIPFVLIITVVAMSIGLLAACNGSSLSKNSNQTESSPASPSKGTEYTVAFKTVPGQVTANGPAMLVFTVRDSNGTAVNDLQIVHEKPMHLLIVSTDLAEFYHVHPETSPDGTYRVQHTFPNGGSYKLYADFTPANSKQIVERIDIKVAGTERPKVALVADTNFEESVDGLKVVMKPSAEIKAGQELTLDFQAFDAASGKPATDLQNYLGELAHFVIISEDMVDFVHAHPMSKGESMKMDGDGAKDHSADRHPHGDDAKAPNKPSASEVSAHTTFPRAGSYKLWAQFQRGGKVISVPFIVNVPAGIAEPIKGANIPTGATQITVSANGYEPSSIPVKKGQPVKLAFYRADANNCGGEVIFAKQNIRKKLPVGETVLVEFTPTEAGEIGFACGMDMLRGKLVVTDN